MAKVDPRWSLDALLHDYRPHEGWRTWFHVSNTRRRRLWRCVAWFHCERRAGKGKKNQVRSH